MEQWLFTIESATGEVCRVEKLDPLSGDSQELTEEQYAAMDSYLEPRQTSEASEPPPDTFPASWEAAAVRAAYWQGVADCAAFYRHYLFGRSK